MGFSLVFFFCLGSCGWDQGSFAQVFAGMCRGLPVAIKQLNESTSVNEQGLWLFCFLFFTRLADGCAGMRKFRDEIAVHQRLYHPNIVLLMGVCVTGSQLMIVQELMYRDLERVLYDESIKVSFVFVSCLFAFFVMAFLFSAVLVSPR